MDKDDDMNKITGILIAVSIMILFASTVSAWVPKEYQTKAFMTDYDVYMVAKNHIGEKWADNYLDDLMKWYSSRPRCMPCLDASMKRRSELEKINSPNPIIKVQKLPGR